MGQAARIFRDPLAFLILVVPLLYSVIAHEVAHGWVAYLFGDDTAKSSGRLSLNPLAHLDPIGTLSLFIVGFGWAKPVPIHYARLRNFRAGLVSVALAGPLANVLIATASLFLLQHQSVRLNPFVTSLLVAVTRVNIILGAFNLIPIPPLDGSRILMGFLPSRAQLALVQLERYGLILLLFLLFTGSLNPVISFVERLILSLIGLLVGAVR
jgi:Zn-dependent protease